MSATGPTEATLAALRMILRPLARIMVARGVTLPILLGVLKDVLVEVAARDFRLDGRPPSDSRISLLTGVHRKDVRALRAPGATRAVPRGGSLAATVVGRWLGDPAFGDGTGAPRPLPRVDPPDGPPGFETLVARVSKDVRPRTVLDELLRQGVATLDPATDTLRLVTEAFLPADSEEALGFLRDNLHDHLAVAAANLLAGPQDRRGLERAVYYNKLAPADVDRLEAEARTLALAALRHLNSLALEAQQQAGGAPTATERFRFGVYFHRAVDPAAPHPPEEA